MKHNFLRKLIEFIKKEKRLIAAAILVLAIFFINQLIFSSQKISPEDCLEGKCGISETEKPQLTKEVGFFYADDVLKDVPSGYYRLTFQSKTDQPEKILIKSNAYTEKNEAIGELSLDVSEKFQNQELFFFLPEGFDNILFEKETPGSEGNVFIQGVSIAKLNVDNREDFASLRKTMVGETNTNLTIAEQRQFSADSFDMLREPKTILGQVFKAQEEYISGISFKMDIIKNPTAGNHSYTLYLWETRCDDDYDDCRTQGEALAKKTFSTASALEKYRQNDGTFLFPFYANIEKGKNYFVGIDNSKAKPDWKNYFDLKGSRDDASYSDGSAGIRNDGVVYKIAGDLFFAVHGVKLDIRDGMRLLNGAKIESLGKGQGKYTYATKGDFSDIFDIWSASPGTNFSEDNKVATTDVREDSAVIYEVNTFFPIQRMHFFAEQTKASWKKVKIEYSFDRKKWTGTPFFEKTKQELLENESIDQDKSTEEKNPTAENKKAEEKKIVYFRTTTDLADLDNMEYSFDQKNWSKAPIFSAIASKSLDNKENKQIYSVDSEAIGDEDMEKDEEDEEEKELVQVFDFDIIPPNSKEKTVYFRITPDLNDPRKASYFSIKNLKITADLKIK